MGAAANAGARSRIADLPPFKDTLIELPVGRLGEHEFSCPEGKLRGTLVVQPAE